MASSDSKIWFITGTSTGLGLAATEAALAKGDTVIATLRKPEVLSPLLERYPDGQLHVIAVDVTQRHEVNGAFAYAREKLGRIDVVFNNAGVGLDAEFEGTPEDTARQLFEVNFWAAAHVLKKSVEFLREVNPKGQGGRIINCSSAAGILTAPRGGYYSATKHAFEAVSEGLAAELQPEWNIKVTLLEPGMFRTPGIDNAPRLEAHPAYRDASGKPLVPSVFDLYPATGDPAKAADAIWRLSRAPEPPLRLALGKDANGAIGAWGAALLKGLEENATWSEDVAFST